ncbi:MAG: response regulator transcription factor [Chloroflexota bacterium]
MSNLSILIIERHPLMRAALIAAIAAEPDMDVAEPSNHGPDALPPAARPDIILLSLGNPGPDDLRALSDLRLLLPETPILALTSNEVPGQEQAALDHGAQAVITKAITRRELIHALRETAAGTKTTSHLPSPKTPKEARIEPNQNQPVSQGTPPDFTKYLERKPQ